jgi:ABC-type antimicrobial peptide transport system ATPase subunit
MVFQDLLTAFKPRATVARILAHPLRVHRLVPRAATRALVAAVMRLPAAGIGDRAGHAGRVRW